MRTVSVKDFSSYFSLIEQDQEMIATLKGIVEFMTNSGGKLPNIESEDEIEKRLAFQLRKYIENGSISKKILGLEDDMQSSGLVK